MISIFEFLNYREYLKKLFEEKKALNAYFSHRSFARCLGLNSSGHILYVIQGKRNLTEDVALRVARYFQLNKRETEYLVTLIDYTDSKKPDAKQFAFSQLASIRRSGTKKIDAAQYAFYEKWYYSAIRLAIEIEPFKDNYKQLGSSLVPSITSSEAKEAVELLEKIGILQKDVQGFYRCTDLVVTTGDSWQSAVIHDLSRQFIELGRDSLDRFPKEERDISAITFTGSERVIGIAREKIKELRAQLLELAREEKVCGKVMQLNVQLFPVFKGNRERES